MKDRIKVGFVGAGGNTQRKHIPFLQAIDGVELIGVANRSLESSQKVVDEFGMSRAYAGWEELINDPELDAVCIGTWPYMHCPVTVAALEAGKHVLCEARMAMNAGEAVRMLEASKAHPELVTQIVPAPFSLTYDAVITNAVESGKLGELLHVEVASVSGSFPDDEAPISWRMDKALSGNNIMGLGIQYETMMRWVGAAQTVFADARVVVAERKDDAGNVQKVEVPDHVHIMGRLENGASYRVQSTRVLGGKPYNATWIYGREGSLEVVGGEKRVLFYSKDDGEPEDITPEPGTYPGWRVEEEFIGAIRGEEPVRLTTFEDGLRYMKYTDAISESSKTGLPVTI